MVQGMCVCVWMAMCVVCTVCVYLHRYTADSIRSIIHIRDHLLNPGLHKIQLTLDIWEPNCGDASVHDLSWSH